MTPGTAAPSASHLKNRLSGRDRRHQTARGAKWMSAQNKLVERFLFRVGPAGIVVGYVLALFGVVAGVVAFPFSSIWLGLPVVVIGAFFVVAISVNVIVCLFFMVAIYRGLMALGSRLLFGVDHCSELQRMSESSYLQKDPVPQLTPKQA
jgi:hypothetical protein